MKFLQWYIGAANGRGTRVGNGASIFVLSLPLLAARVHSSMQKMLFPIMIIVTALLVAGYSWNDGYLPRVGNPGQGTDVAWRRGLLVMIGAVRNISPHGSLGHDLTENSHCRESVWSS